MQARRSLSAIGSRTQQLAGEIAIGAGATVVLVTGTGLSGLGSAPTVVAAAAPPVLTAPTLSNPAVVAMATPRVDAVRDWSRGSHGSDGDPAVLMPPAITTAAQLVAQTPAPSDTQLPVAPPAHPSIHDTGRQLKQAMAAPSTSVLSNLPSVAAPSVAVPQGVPVGLPLLSK
jgi:hypothetical protein